MLLSILCNLLIAVLVVIAARGHAKDAPIKIILRFFTALSNLLCALTAGKDRHLIIVTGITSEGWNNTEGQCLAYAASQPVWDLLGAGNQNNMIIHLDGHAILPSDMESILDYCDVHLPGKSRDGVSGIRSRMKGNLFLEDNRDRLDPAFDGYEAEIRSVLSRK